MRNPLDGVIILQDEGKSASLICPIAILFTSAALKAEYPVEVRVWLSENDALLFHPTATSMSINYER